MDEYTNPNQTVILSGGRVDYAMEDCQVSIEELIAALQEAQQEGATHVVMSSGNSRGASWASVNASWEWVEDDQY